MESGKVAAVLVATIIALLSVIGSISGKPMDQQWSNNPQPINSHYEFHPIDNCIFACDHCFKDDALVRCANACILSEATLGQEWTTTCPYLSRQYTNAVGASYSNPFRH